MTKVWTAVEIQDKLSTNLNWLEKGIVAIYQRQTADEQAVGETRDQNGVGFNGCDASYLSYCAKWIMGGHHLSGDHVEKARDKMLKYAGQLADIASSGCKATSDRETHKAPMNATTATEGAARVDALNTSAAKKGTRTRQSKARTQIPAAYRSPEPDPSTYMIPGDPEWNGEGCKPSQYF